MAVAPAIRRYTRIVRVGGAVLLAAAVLFVTSCSSWGPRHIAPDRFNYNEAIARSAKEQMLLNIVRLRYLEVPLFLSLGSVLTQYFYAGTLGVGGTVDFSSAGKDTATGSLEFGYVERPTITYLPVEGREFAAHLLSPIPAEMFFAAAQAGWPSDILMRIGIQRIGAMENISLATMPITEAPERQPYLDREFEKARRFKRALRLMLILSDDEIMEVQIRKEGGNEARYLVFSDHVPPNLQPQVAELKELLGLGAQNAYRFTEHLTQTQADEISIQTRSILAMMDFLSKGVEVPAEHLQAGSVVDYTFIKRGRETERLIPFRIRSGKDKPDNSFSSVKYGAYWYFIENNDINSKRTLGLIMNLFRLQAPTPEGAAPLLTIPTG